MEELLQADIFFFITSITVIVLGIFLGIAGYYVVKIIKIIHRIMIRVEEGSEILTEDIQQLHGEVKNGTLLSRLMGYLVTSVSIARKQSSNNNEDTE